MKLNKYFPKLLVLALPFTFFACSELDESERLIELEDVPVNRAVLIEDFTGQKCVNCPAASTLIESLQEKYGAENIVAVGIHSGPMAEETPLRTEMGDYLYKKYNVEAQPSGLINRRDGVFKGTDQWKAQVRREIVKPTILSIDVTNATTSNDSIYIELDVINADTLSSISGMLNVWITEDGIESPQYMEDGGASMDYVHNHVFRTAVTFIDGEYVSVESRQTKRIELKTEISDAWQVENLSVVAFVDSNNGVLQAVKAKVINN